MSRARRDELSAHVRECGSCETGSSASCSNATHPVPRRDWELLCQYLAIRDAYAFSSICAPVTVEQVCRHFSFGAHRGACAFEDCPFYGADNELALFDWAQSHKYAHTYDSEEQMQHVYQQAIPGGRFPLLRLPAELRNHIYRHALVDEDYTLTDGHPYADALSLYATCRQINYEAKPLAEAEASLLIDLNANLCLCGQDRCSEITTEDFLKTNSIRRSKVVPSFQNLRLVAGEATQEGALGWRRIAYNLRTIMIILKDHGHRPTGFSINIFLGRMGGLVRPDPLEDPTALWPRAHPARELQDIMDSFRNSYGLMSKAESNSHTWVRAPATMTAAEEWDWAYKAQEVDVVFKLLAMRYLGKIGRRLGKRIFLKGPKEEKDWDWTEPDPKTEESSRNRRRGGPDPKDLYLLANEMHDGGEGVWLCAK